MPARTEAVKGAAFRVSGSISNDWPRVHPARPGLRFEAVPGLSERSSPPRPALDWNGVMGEKLIASDPSVLAGKACVRGTRLSVEFLLELAASGATQPEVLRQYPQLTAEGLATAYRYAAQALKGEQTWE